MEYNITYRKKDKGWQYIISYKDQSGKWRQRSKQGFKTRALAKVAAEKRVDKMKEQFEMQKNADPEYMGLTFKEFADKFISHKNIYLESNTMMSYKTALKHFTDLNDMTMEQITTLDIQSCVDEMVKELLPTTVQTYLNKIKTIFIAAVNPYKILTVNPVQNIRIPDDKREEKEKALSKAESETLLRKVSPNRKYYIGALLALKCGLRVGEIVGLTWDRIDFKAAQIVINRQWKRLKNGKHGFGTVKSKNSNRIVPAPAIVISELKKFKKEYPIHISGRILPYAESNNLGKYLSSYLTKVGFPDTTIHDLRHTYGTMLISNGLDFKTVADLMGHDIKETMETYSHVTSDMREKAKNLINEIF